MFLFNKYRTIDTYPDDWKVSANNEGTFTLRLNIGLDAAMGHPQYPIKVGIALPFKSDESTDIIFNKKNAIEDALDDIWKNDNSGVLAAVIINNSEAPFIELLSYAEETVDFSGLHEKIIQTLKDDSIQMYAENDSKWDTYKSLKNM